jgi:hypothetical protein
MEDFQRLKNDHLKAFIDVRTLKDLKMPVKKLNKGTAEDVTEGDVKCWCTK